MVRRQEKEMKKSLTQRGNGWALIVPKDIIKLLAIDPQTAKLKFEFKDKVLHISEISPDNPDFEKCLVRKFSKKDSSWTLYMSNSIIGLLKIDPATDELEIDVDGQVLIIKKAD